MLKRPVIHKSFITQWREILYLEEDPSGNQSENPIIINRGHRFSIPETNTGNLEALSEKCEVIGWVERTDECPYDFILFDSKQEKYYLAILRGREDGWPLFSVQEGGYTCARSRMGSEWSCRLCVQYFGTVCRGR